ncbi:hypothetical protein [Nostoc sp. TCL26-01]|nr:hypothetical protein [Nostoc sp. TCL26-01]
MAKQPKQPKMPKMPKAPKPIKLVKGYMKKDGTFINPYFKGGF